MKDSIKDYVDEDGKISDLKFEDYCKMTLSLIADDKVTFSIKHMEYCKFWLKYAITHNNVKAIDVIVSKFNIPDNLDLKEKIAYIQLLGGE